jgi:GTP-binding protein
VIGGLAIIGSPNVGKSTMLNRLIGSERSVVSPVAGTTVDPVEAYLNVDFHTDVDMVDAFWNATQKDRYLGTMQKYSQVPPNESCSRSLLILDTAGIRSKSSVEGFLETQSVFRSLRCMSESDLIIYVIDAFKGLTHQDRSLIGLAIEKGKAIILVLNKYDQVKKELPTSQERDDWYEHWTTMAPWLKHCDMIPLSAKTGEGVSKLNQKIKDYFILRAKPIPTSAINEILKKLVEEKSLNFREGKSVPFKIKYASVVKVFPVTILVFVNRSKGIPENYRKYLVNGLKDQLGWKNFPVHFIFRTNSEREERERLFQERQSESRAP